MQFSTYADDRSALEAGETSCHQLVSSFLDRIERDNPRLNAFISIDNDGALARASELDSDRERGHVRPLHGMVVAVKDMIVQRGLPATAGSRMLEDFKSLFSATVIDRLEDAGVIIIGRTNCDEFGMGSSGETSYFGPTRNPVDDSRVAGGSSGGSAAAVAAGLCHTALGTDTGGSVRQPASFCGIASLKPTYGRISRYGAVANASSFDVIGPMARSVRDVALMMEVMAGLDEHDSTSAPADVPPYGAGLTGDVAGLRVGIPTEFVSQATSPGVRNALSDTTEALRDAGAIVTDISLPRTRYGVATYYILTMAEASSNLARYDGVRFGYRAPRDSWSRKSDHLSAVDRQYVASRSEGFGSEVKRRIMLGTYVLSTGYYDAYYAKAQRVRRLIRNDFEEAFGQVDVLLGPTSPSTAFRMGEHASDPLEMYLNDVCTVTASLAGVPALVVPGGRDAQGLPVGLQLIAPHFAEAALLKTGDALMKIRADIDA